MWIKLYVHIVIISRRRKIFVGQATDGNLSPTKISLSMEYTSLKYLMYYKHTHTHTHTHTRTHTELMNQETQQQTVHKRTSIKVMGLHFTPENG